MIDYYKDNDDIEVVDERPQEKEANVVVEAKRKKATPVSLSTLKDRRALRLLNLLS